jgi:hypothetical protein
LTFKQRKQLSEIAALSTNPTMPYSKPWSIFQQDFQFSFVMSTLTEVNQLIAVFPQSGSLIESVVEQGYNLGFYNHAQILPHFTGKNNLF